MAETYVRSLCFDVVLPCLIRTVIIHFNLLEEMVFNLVFIEFCYWCGRGGGSNSARRQVIGYFCLCQEFLNCYLHDISYGRTLQELRD